MRNEHCKKTKYKNIKKYKNNKKHQPHNFEKPNELDYAWHIK